MEPRRFYVMYKHERTTKGVTESSGGVMKAFESADEAYAYLDQLNDGIPAGWAYYVQRI